jgi:hypothetical protein
MASQTLKVSNTRSRTRAQALRAKAHERAARLRGRLVERVKNAPPPARSTPTGTRFLASHLVAAHLVPGAESLAPVVPVADALAADLPAVTAPHPVAARLDREDALWVRAHRNFIPPAGTPENTALVFADDDFQQWMGETLTSLGWDVHEPAMFTEGWVPARGETLETGQPVTSYTTASKSAGGHARKNDPKTSKKAGAAASANQSITVNSHQGQLLFAYAHQHEANRGHGYTAAEAVGAAGLHTDGATGSPWRRVTDLRDTGFLTHLLDETGQRVVRKNESNSDGAVLVITPLGIAAAKTLTVLRERGIVDEPLSFDDKADPSLFEDLPATLVRLEDTDPDTQPVL